MENDKMLEKKLKSWNLHANMSESFIKKIQNACSNYTEESMTLLQTLENSLRRKIEKVGEIHEEIMNILDDESDLINQEEKHQEFVIRNENELRKLIKFMEKKTMQEVTNSNISTNSTKKISMKLPKLTIKPFDGDPLCWKSFYDTFMCTIDSNDDLSNVEKMSYLVSFLKGQAEQTLKGFRISNENYTAALDLLKQRYGDEQLLISSHMSALIEMKPATQVRDVTELRKLHDNIESQVRSLSALGLDSKNYGPMLIPVIINKIPNEIKLSVSKDQGKDVWDITKLLQILREEIEARERIHFNNNNISVKTPMKERDSFPTASSLLNNSRKSLSNRTHFCIFCEKNVHKSQDCDIVSDLQERKQILRKLGRCFICLRTGHISKNCFSKISCLKCSRRHHLAVCDELVKDKALNTTTSVSGVENETTVNVIHDENKILLQTARASVFSNDKSVSKSFRILFDTGSQLSYVSPKVKDCLNLKPLSQSKVSVKVFGGTHSLQTLDQVNIFVKDSSGFESICVNAYVSDICQPLTGQAIEIAVKRFPHLQNLKLADSNPSENEMNIDILIGADNYWKFFNQTVIKSSEGGPVAMGSKLGFVLSGPLFVGDSNYSSMLVSGHTMRIENEVINERNHLNNLVEKFWNLESLGVSNHEESTFEKFTNETKFVDGRYEVKLPFINEHVLPDDNLNLSKNRLKGLVKRNKHNDLLRKCDDIFKEQLDAGIIEVVDIEKHSHDQISYLPHRPVIRENKDTSKIRIVFDCSAKEVGGTSLNDCLITGPSLTPSLYNVLLKFRSYNIAFNSDIEKAFLQISIDPNYRDFLRFLWLTDINQIDYENFENNELKTFRLTRVLFGATSSPFSLTATLIKHFEKFKAHDPVFVNKVLSSLHVDDLISGADDESSATNFYLNCKGKLAEGNFNLRKFNSNSVVLENTMNDKELSNELIFEDEVIKVLGVNWNKSEDLLFYNFQHVFEKSNSLETKRSVLQLIASIYDPLGLINPVVVSMKTFFQELWSQKLSWDDKLHDDLLDKWNKILNAFRQAPLFAVPRLYCFKDRDDPFVCLELHGFSDASSVAYGACIYLRFKYLSGNVKTCLITAKSKVKPLNKVTIPRLELLGCLLLSRLTNNVRNCLYDIYTFDNVFLWTDSSIAYSWIVNKNREYKTFVQNRVKEINEFSDGAVWKLIPSVMNPADILSRGCTPVELYNNKLWLNGPEFLILQETHWPQLTVGESFYTEIDNEVKNNDVITCLLSVNDSVNLVDNEACISVVIDVNKHNCFDKLLRLTCWVVKFIDNLKKKKEERRLDKTKNKTSNNKRRSAEEMLGGLIGAEEMLGAFHLWIKYAQKFVRNNKKYLHWKQSLNVFEDEQNNLRCRGRLFNAPIPYNAKCPLLLSTNCHITELIVINSHEKVFHNGLRETLNHVRQNYWIPKGRSFVRKIINSCYLCKRLEGKPYSYPNPPQLPAERLSIEHAFSSIGIDHAGPVHVKNIYGDSNETFKAWIVLITCASSRAIYLDLASSLSSKECVETLKRFIARYGAPKVVISDNGKAFISQEVQSFASKRNIVWKFNLEASPWQGGFFERMVRSVKRCLKKILLNARATFFELNTLLKEIEMVINNRPLTYTYQDFTDVPLTPNHLIYGRVLNETSSLKDTIVNEEIDVDKRKKYVRTLIEHFWSRWLKEYLSELRENYRPTTKNAKCVPRKNDVVLIIEDKKPRINWTIGRIEEILESNDGEVRGAKVRTINSQGHESILKRPVNKLVPLELSKYETHDEIEFVDDKCCKFIDPHGH